MNYVSIYPIVFLNKITLNLENKLVQKLYNAPVELIIPIVISIDNPIKP